MAGFFDVEERLHRLRDLGDQLELYAQAVDLEVFRPVLEKALAWRSGAHGGWLGRWVPDSTLSFERRPIAAFVSGASRRRV
ncbi:hypothetical protein SAMN06273572_1156 [Monaibacterium marinum]|uniref:Transposase n=2 Tax=Pontivivens marinum TaxID=1690039 RepID=A0A2C9CWU0_9RHOB|nr:hypothetical protein SAMN06273572_1156 [Monaibacterium marinum]